MRHSDPGGRFTLPYEQNAIYSGIDGELRAPVGHYVKWIRFNLDESRKDDIYDVGDQVTGRQWDDPIRIPAFSAIIFQGPTIHNDRGFYNTDILRFSAAMNVIESIFPDIVWSVDEHIKDRLLYRGRIFIPTRLYPRGLLRNSYTVFTLDANQVNPEEYVNDPQLVEWANQDIDPPQPFDPQKVRLNSSYTS